MPRIVALVPARGGSKGIPGKNVAPLAGRPLIEYTLRFARACPEIERTLVSTDDKEIAAVAAAAGGEVIYRPAELAADDTPLWPVMRHALDQVDPAIEFLLVLEPTGPFRLTEDLATAIARLVETPTADGIVAVSRPDFNPIWVCVVERDGWMENLVEEGRTFERRQDLPDVFRINGLFFLFRTSFVRELSASWMRGRILTHEVPEQRALHIDHPHQLEIGTLMLENGLVELPWLSDA
jgi:CMP-N-acetylneuraminic acid synthetase